MNKGEYADKVIQAVMTRKAYSCVLYGPAGLGKSRKIELNAMKLGLKEGEDIAIAPTYMTETKLYKFISDNLGKIIILDDCGVLLKKPNVVRALKDALWKNGSHKRVMKYWSYFKDKDFPSEIDVSETFFILTYNEIKIDPDVDAVLSRTLPRVEIDYTYEEKLDKMMVYAKDRGDDYTKVAEELLKHLTKFHRIDFRMLEHGYSFLKSDPNNWKELVEKMLSLDIHENKVVKLFKNIYGEQGLATTLELKKLISINHNVGLRQAEKLINEALEACLLERVDDRKRGGLIKLSVDPEKVWEAKLEDDKMERFEKAQAIVRAEEVKAEKFNDTIANRMAKEFLDKAMQWVKDPKNKDIVSKAREVKRGNELIKFIAKEFMEGREPDTTDIKSFITNDCPIEESIGNERDVLLEARE